MTIYIGADYRGRELKNKIIGYLENCNYEVIDPFSDDREVIDVKIYFGFFICDSVCGFCFAAIKVKGIRCVRAATTQDAFLGRDHDGANILALGSEITPEIDLVKDIIDTFINTPMPTLERRIKRFKQIEKYEEEN